MISVRIVTRASSVSQTLRARLEGLPKPVPTSPR
jgi:hypothetical protein